MVTFIDNLGNEMLQPVKLKQADEVLLIAPARKVDLNALKAAESLLHQWGLKPIRGKSLLLENGIFGGTDQERKKDLQWALDHPTAKAIWCYRGGYGTVRLLEDINPTEFLNFPKWIIGFSDVTFLHCFSNIILNTASIHATMPINVRENTTESLNSLKSALFDKQMHYQWEVSNSCKNGNAEGELIGGNLAVLCATLGTNYQPDFEDKILFIEEIDEYMYAIDRLFWQLKFAGVFHHIKGLIIGHFSKLKDNDISFGMTLEEIILEKVKEFNYPVVFGFPAGHENENKSLILGAKTRLEVNQVATLRTV